jgi:hypothetical protein
MKLPRLTRRQAFESASLLLIGLALVAVAIRLLSSFASDIDQIAFTFWFVGFTLIGAGALCPFRCEFSGGLIGFIVSVYLALDQATTGVDANDSFMKVAEKIAATDAESNEQANATSAAPSQPDSSD